MSQCSVPGCKLEMYPNDTKCVLHCEKRTYSEDFNRPPLLPAFFDALIDNIVEQISLYEKGGGVPPKDAVKASLQGKLSLGQFSLLKQKEVAFSLICFPDRDDRDKFDYLQVLNKLGGVHFATCEFTGRWLDVRETKCFFQDCRFLGGWSIYNLDVLGNGNNVLYQGCIFEESVSTSHDDDDKTYKITSPLFYNCTFNGNIDFESVDFEKRLFVNDDKHEGIIKRFTLSSCHFSERFVLNNFNIESFYIEDTVFKSKFELKENVIDDLEINNTNFLAIADFYGSTFKLFSMKKGIFEDFVGFEDCIFGIEGVSGGEHVAGFMYVTFLSFANFRNAIFRGGLDIEYINLKEAPNFLKAYVPLKTSNRETFRIIKNSFDRIGNHIEANKFFVLEMQKYKEDLTQSGVTQERVVFILNSLISDFGQSYLRPIAWLMAFGLLYTGLVVGYEKGLLYHIYVPANDTIDRGSYWLNCFASNLLPFNKFLKSGMEFVSLIFYIVFVTLVWQIVIAVKRHVRR